jgi:excisionase family DNA binding protein
MDGIVDASRSDPGALTESSGGRSYFNIAQAAALLGVSRVTIWRWIRAGRLRVSRLGHRTTRVKIEDIERLLAQNGPGNSHSSDFYRKPGAGIAAEGNARRAQPPQSYLQEMGASEHFVQFYESDAFLVGSVADFIGAALRAGDAGIVVATSAHRVSIEECLWAQGLDLAAAQARSRYVPLDAIETLAQFMVDGMPDPDRFTQVIGRVIARVAGFRHVRAFGEMVALLAVEGNVTAAIRLEELWNDLQQRHSFSLFCAYPMHRLGGEEVAELLGDVCAQHSRVIPGESYTALPTADDRHREVVALQQKASWLEAEIAQRKQAEEQLWAALAAERSARDEAESALRLRDEFLSTAAHELKTPLTSLVCGAQLALRRLERDTQSEPKQVARSLQMIEGQGKKLSRLLNQLLDVSRLEIGKLTLECQPTDLVPLVEQTVAGARAWSDRHDITLVTPASLEAEVDSLRVEQVLINLLDNAVKYSPDGGPIEVILSHPVPTSVEMVVCDRGLGIPPEQRGQIFERFYQAHSNGFRSGLGLGLHVSRQIVEMHGGEIRAEFPPDGGTCFIVRLPIDQTSAASRDHRGPVDVERAS